MGRDNATTVKGAKRTMTLPKTLDPESIVQRIQSGAAAAVAAELHVQRPADVAEILMEIPDAAEVEVLAQLSAGDIGSVLEFLIREEESVLEPFAQLSRENLSAILNRTPLGTAARVLRGLPDGLRNELMETVADRQIVETLLAQDRETAGALVTTDFIALRDRMTVSQAQAAIREAEALTRRFVRLFVVDAEDRLSGSVDFRQLLLASPNAHLSRIMDQDPISVPAGTDQEECARLMQRYRLDVLPTVDEDGRLLGFIDLAEVLHVAEGEATEDMYMIVGLNADESVQTGIRSSIKLRMPWLLLNLATAFAAAAVVGLFESTVAKAALLAAFLPIVGGQGGNAIIQTVTIVVRSIALGDMTLRNARGVLLKEIVLGGVHGVVLGIIAFGAAYMWSRDVWLSGALGIAMVVNMIVAGATGVLIPLILRRFGIDPALAAGIFGTTVTDVVGFGVLLGLAAVSISVLGL